ncbi:MAG: mannose-1-phosphate guanylyltransferase [Syntrophales bacterium]|nr:mannose-1-phosphate guanylyltransferase [Syntrophales bacterium]
MYAVIMAGGRGARFWPRSREKYPKHLLDIISAETILRETVNRIIPIVSPDRVFIVTGASHAAEVRKQLPELPRENILVEPEGKNTAPCIGLAAIHLRKKDREGIMMVLPSDHFIADEEKFLRVLAIAGKAAEEGENLITVGISPVGPETGYGYLERGEKKFTIDGEDIHQVRSVREKPDKNEADILIRQGGFFWNGGIFIGKASTFLNAIARWLPDLYRHLVNMEAALGNKDEETAINRAYASIIPVSFDYGVMEKADNILMVRGDFGWSDVGSWDALYQVLSKDEHGNSLAGGGVFLNRNSRNSFVHSPHKLVAMVGVEDLIVVDTKDALLICRRSASQEVKNIVELLEQKNLKEYL